MDAKNKLLDERCKKKWIKRYARKTSLNSPRTARTNAIFFFLKIKRMNQATNKVKGIGYNRRCRSFELWYQNDTGRDSDCSIGRSEVQEPDSTGWRTDGRTARARLGRMRGMEMADLVPETNEKYFYEFYESKWWTGRTLNEKWRTESKYDFL